MEGHGAGGAEQRCGCGEKQKRDQHSCISSPSYNPQTQDSRPAILTPTRWRRGGKSGQKNAPTLVRTLAHIPLHGSGVPHRCTGPGTSRLRWGLQPETTFLFAKYHPPERAGRSPQNAHRRQPTTDHRHRCVQTAIGQPPIPTKMMLRGKKMDCARIPAVVRVQYSPDSLSIYFSPSIVRTNSLLYGPEPHVRNLHMHKKSGNAGDRTFWSGN